MRRRKGKWRRKRRRRGENRGLPTARRRLRRRIKRENESKYLYIGLEGGNIGGRKGKGALFESEPVKFAV